ncbi:MAG: hypothetical protein JW839_09590 [Candidatus Lokiarchaeota archaeon]|nr:hypothetical protein [Candidatus Lokiarchaeota archaeon]
MSNGETRWAYNSIDRIPGTAEWNTLMPGAGIRLSWDRNPYLAAGPQTTRVGIFIAYESSGTPTSQRREGMVRFDEWLVHHLNGDRYDSMVDNYGSAARAHPSLAQVFDRIGLVDNVDYVKQDDGKGHMVPYLTRSGEEKIMPWFALYATNRGNFEGSGQTFLEWHLQKYGAAYDGLPAGVPERYARFKEWASHLFDPSDPGEAWGGLVVRP